MSSFSNELRSALIKSALVGCAAVGLYAFQCLMTGGEVEENLEAPPQPTKEQTID